MSKPEVIFLVRKPITQMKCPVVDSDYLVYSANPGFRILAPIGTSVKIEHVPEGIQISIGKDIANQKANKL